jgi:hypothetical protein
MLDSTSAALADRGEKKVRRTPLFANELFGLLTVNNPPPRAIADSRRKAAELM